MQESLQASATGAPASYSELRFSPGIGKIYKRLHKRSKEGGRNWIGEGDWRIEAKEPGGVPHRSAILRCIYLLSYKIYHLVYSQTKIWFLTCIEKNDCNHCSRSKLRPFIVTTPGRAMPTNVIAWSCSAPPLLYCQCRQLSIMVSFVEEARSSKKWEAAKNQWPCVLFFCHDYSITTKATESNNASLHFLSPPNPLELLMKVETLQFS